MGDAATSAEEWTALTRPLARLLGAKTASALEKLGLATVGDLLLHVPFRLAHRGELMGIERVMEGESVTVVGRVMNSTLRPMNARRGFILTITISDGNHDLSLTFFAKSSRPLKFHESRLAPGTVAVFSGTISSYRGQLQLNHPDYELLENEDEVNAQEITKPIPIYHASASLPSWKIAKAVEVILPQISEANVPDPLPASYRTEHHLPSKFAALRALHAPQTDAEWEAALERMRHEEAFVLQSVLATRRATALAVAAPAMERTDVGALATFDSCLPWPLTDGQREVGEEIAADLATTLPMRRLLQGDVGAGKTVVALRAMLQAVDSGRQAVLLAPTEVLASQHLETLRALLGDLATGGQLMAPEHAVQLEYLVGSLGAKERRQALANIASGAAGIVVGTHALLQENVQIPFLGLVVVDEQHRFGVDQRDALSHGAHMLVMTATPIPRTIAMTSFGDLDVSTLRQLRAGRAGITTNLVPASKAAWMERVWQRAREEVDAGGRVFVVCPRISADDDADAPEPVAEDLFGADAPLASVEGTLAELAQNPALTGVGIGAVHGRMSAAEKDAAMASFSAGRAPVLVATTVIEVGVDVPDATMMVILDADRFGLAQLHQLRGRIGRGTKPGLCLAVHNSLPGTLAYERLEAFASTNDGFALANADLELRSEGDVLGAAQSGRGSTLRFLSVLRDARIIDTARESAMALVERDPRLVTEPALAAAVAATHADYIEKG
ncbi:ATP-dependent DNA helicase RecG [Arcanobacterium wilhelmae]|uniref:Probable DNA 3'-5' helicase RecG n=1 Tax=Arcanobacterium wilhelmae TaxID=1803177 RepID=A0ABT9NDL5_9ACTO|nr:ATP-dependent DNA helicase RecG [Arcanobacterium wilhelmae]MDP9801618.1 ATP-dependent DNA helicase RecG [Arcanobacterium wilhelmae]